MRCRATVLKTEGNIAEIEVRRATMCEGCEKSGGCGGHCDISGIVATGGKMTAKAYNKIGAAVGDTVEVETESSRVLAYAALVFLLPLVIGGVFFALAAAVSDSDGIALAAAFAGFVLTFVFVAVVDRKAAKKRPDIVIVNRL